MAATVLALAAAPLALLPSTSQAVSAGIVISEVYGAGGNSGALWNADFVELHNPTGAPIDLAGTAIQYRSTGGGVSAVPFALTGTVPAGGRWLVRMSAVGVNGAALPTPDAVASPAFAMSGTNGQVALTATTTAFTGTGDVAGNAALVDFVGYGTGNNTFEGAQTGVSLTASTAAHRTAADSDHNANDFSESAPSPTNSAGQTTSPLGATDPGDKTAVVGNAITPFTLAASGGTAPYTWGATGLPAGLSISTGGEVSGTPTSAGESTVTATVTDAASATASTEFVYTVTQGVVITPIADIQGTGAASPLVGQTVTTEGIVTAVYRTGGLNGMYVQTAGTGDATDETPGASDSVFVFGAHAMPAGVERGDSVRVTGVVSEFNGTTEITPGAGEVTELGSPLAAVAPLAAAYPTTEAEREAHEGELLAPTDAFTVTNTFQTNRFGEVGLATGDHPLIQPTELHRDDDAAGLAAVKADNSARAVTLDDGATIDFVPSQGNLVPPANRPSMDIPLPYLTPGNPIRVGASATLTQPVILNFAFGAWRFQPTTHLTADGTPPATFENTRADNLTPSAVGGDLKIATFNVLNYFNTTGADFVANGTKVVPNVATTCTYFYDRDDDEVANNSCNPNGPRGAAEADDLTRQQQKVVTAINGLGADVVSLEEIENSVKLVSETWRDDALSHLVNALNTAAGSEVWRFVATPVEASTAAGISESDVIRTAFIYKKASVRPVGVSDILFDADIEGTSPFANAREPLAQAFKPVGAPNSASFAVVVNHFKSKGDSTPPATGDNANDPDVGAFNGDRTRQAQALVTFANDFAARRGTDKIFLAGDFNSYTHEDPMHVLYDAGFAVVESDTEGEESYSFNGLSGSLDHVLANGPALATVTGADIWEINANESVAFQYSRHNYNATQFFQGDNPFAASDHNPEIVGIDLPGFTPHTKDVQVLATNDFHGRLQNNTGATEAGAAVLSGAVKQLRAENPDTVFAAAGDLIGASTFESFIANDKPTIDALNEAGLEVSGVGNHEFDQGYDDLVNRVMKAYDAETNPEGGAEWQYIGANVTLKATGDPAVPATWVKDFGDGVRVGFIGAVTEDLPSLVNPEGIAEIQVGDIVESTNHWADDLVANQGADVVVLLVHEGAPGTNCATMDDDPASAFGSIIHGVNDKVDAIVSGHTHLKYNCSFEVPGWAGRPVTKRPVVSAGQYGMALNQLVFEVDTTTGDVLGLTQEMLDLKSNNTTFNYPVDPATKAIVDAAVTAAEGPGSQVLGKIAGPFAKAKFASGTDNRGGESTLGNLVAEVQRWATPAATVGAAQLAFMNPGGLRTDMVGNPGPFPRDLTYRQAANVQPFANTLVNMDLTGAQIKKVLEQQWQRTLPTATAPNGTVPTRAFLKLGLSAGLRYTYHQVEDPLFPGQKKGVITGIWLNGVPVDPAASYSVTVNSFLAAGGDNFHELRNGSTRQDTGKTDLQAMVEYMAEFGSGASGVPISYAQQAVGVTFPAAAPTSYDWGDTVAFDLFSLSMTDPADVKDTEVRVKHGSTVLGTFPVTTVQPASPDGSANSNDDAGTASVSFTLPEGIPGGSQPLTVEGVTTGTTATVPIQVNQPEPTFTASAEDYTYGTPGSVAVTLDSGFPTTGEVVVSAGGTELARGTIADGTTVLTIPGTALTAGAHTLTVAYTGDAHVGARSVEVAVDVLKADPTVAATLSDTTVKVKKETTTATVTVSATGFVPTGTVGAYVDGSLVQAVALVNGTATLTIGPFSTVGPETITFRYLGDANTLPDETSASVTVVRQRRN